MTEFLEARKTANSARYIETIKNLRRRLSRVRGSTSRILLLHDNERPHTARATIDALETLKFEVLSHPPYSPDLEPSDFHFFPHLKRDLKGTPFTSDDEVKQAVTSWIKQRTHEFFIDGMCIHFSQRNVGKNVLNGKATMSKNRYVNLQPKCFTLLPTFVCLNTWSLFLDISLFALLISRPSYRLSYSLPESSAIYRLSYSLPDNSAIYRLSYSLPDNSAVF